MVTKDKEHRELAGIGASLTGALRGVGSRALGRHPRDVPAAADRSSRDVPGAVVVGCDGDLDSYGALRFAAWEAAVRAAPLIVVSTYLHPVDPDVALFDVPETALAHHAVATARGALCEALSVAAEALPAHEVMAVPGLPAHVLLTTFAQAQLLVVGSHQRHLVSRVLHGASTSANLIHHAHTPVVVVPADWQPPDPPRRHG